MTIQNLENRLHRISKIKTAPQVYINIPAEHSEDGKEHWKCFGKEIKKPKVNPGDIVFIENVGE